MEGGSTELIHIKKVACSVDVLAGCARDQILWDKEPKTGVGVGTVKNIHDTEWTPVVFPWSRGRRKMESIDSTEKWRPKRNKEKKIILIKRLQTMVRFATQLSVHLSLIHI